MDGDAREQIKRVYKDMPLATGDLLGRVKALRIEKGRPWPQLMEGGTISAAVERTLPQGAQKALPSPWTAILPRRHHPLAETPLLALARLRRQADEEVESVANLSRSRSELDEFRR